MSDLPQHDQAMIEREIFGVRPPPTVHFYLHGAKNGDATMQAGYPVYTDRIYIQEKIPDCPDYMSRVASPADIRQHKEAYALFERSREWKHHSLELLPGMSPALLATCRELGYFTIEQLADHTPENAHWTKIDEGDPYPALSGQLPPALQEVKVTAKRFASFNKPRLRLVDGKMEQVA